MFTDIHCHILCCTDDGPDTKEQMFKMLECAYNDGIRSICVTPHFNHHFYSDNSKNTKDAYALLCEYAKDSHPDIEQVR